ncbi:MAG TPA: MFS transporter [Kofleriaceae bacterium]|nr:MFS transporter [Kofleriaceae bacterium]
MSRNRTEWIVAAWSAITFGALLTAIMVSRPVRDSLALEGDPDQIPWLFTGTFVAFTIAVPLWSSAVAKEPRRVALRSFHSIALFSLGFFALMRFGIAPVVTGYAFYIWSSVYNMLVVSAFWSLLADLFDPKTASKLYGPISAGGTIGAFAGPALTRLALEYVDVSYMFILIAIALELAVLGVHQVRTHGAKLRIDPLAEKPLPHDPWAGLKHLMRNRYLAAIGGFVLCTSAAATFVYLAQAGIVKTSFADKNARTAFFANVDMWTQALTFAVQMLLARPLLGWLGPGLVLCVLPLAQGAGMLALAAAPTLATLVAVQVTSRTATHGLTRPARELLFTVVNRDEKYRGKHVIDTLVLRFGDFASSWLYTGLVAISASATTLSLAAIPLTLVWLVLALVLGAGFRRRASAKETS